MLFCGPATPGSRHRPNYRRRTRGTPGTSTRGRGRDRGRQTASSNTRVITQVLHDDDDDFMPPRSRRAPNSSNDWNPNVTNATMISADDPNDDFMPARPQHYQPSLKDPDDPDHADDDPDHADDVFQDIYRTTIPRTRGAINYSDWQRMNRNFPFQLFD